jgi:aquaporin Z
MKKYIAEFLATFCLIFIGIGVVAAQPTSIYHEGIGPLGIALVWGITVSAMIYTFGKISGAHMNPAVTITFWMVKLFDTKHVLPYIISQVLGSLVACLCLRYLFPLPHSLGITRPAIDPMFAFMLETGLSFILMLVILFTSQGSKETGILSGLAVGGIILAEILFGGALTGASMNPARSLAPAIVTMYFQDLWIYVTAPFLGMLMAGIVWMLMKEK